MGKVCEAAPQDDGRPLSKSLRHSQPLNELTAQWDDMRAWYGESRVQFWDPLPRAPGQTQQDPINWGVDAALRSGRAYRSMIVWRWDVALLAPVAAPKAPDPRDDHPPTDYLETDRDEPGIVNFDVGWSVPWRVAQCFRDVVGATGDASCWQVDVLSTVGGMCRDRLNENFARTGVDVFRRNFACAPRDEPVLKWMHVIIEMHRGGTRLARWQDAHGFLYSGGVFNPPKAEWTHLCPQPLVLRKFSDAQSRELCEYLRDHDGGIPCDEAPFVAEVCTRLQTTPEIRPALEDPAVRSSFKCELPPP